MERGRAGEADTVAGARFGSSGRALLSSFHRLGKARVGRVNWPFRSSIRDVLSGYRAFARDRAASLPLTGRGLEIETGLAVQALGKGFVVREVPVEYRARLEGSCSNLRTFGDGWLALSTILRLFKGFRPLAFYSAIAGVLFVAGLIPGLVVVGEFIDTSYVARVPPALSAVGAILLSFLFFMSGLILDTINARFWETWRLTKRLAVANLHNRHLA